jgi:hypothetical protein
MTRLCAALAVVVAVSCLAGVSGQGRNGFVESFKHPAIDYYDGPLADDATALARRVGSGETRLAFDPASGYLKAVLDALKVPVESQVVVFSQTSQQGPIINEKNPRAVYFNDRIAVGWVRGGTVLEIAAQDPRRGVVFYTLDQKAAERPAFERPRECLRCHVSWDTFGVPGVFVLSTGPADAGGYATGGVVDDRDPIAKRWGGWYLTGSAMPAHHMGKAAPAPRWLAGMFDTSGYPTPHSDVVALMVLEHQTHVMNLITYVGWESRVGASPQRLQAIVRDLVDALLFVDEAPLPGRVRGSTAFAEHFSAEGPHDRQGRSLRQFDLERRMMKYPCSYMIDTPAFAALPASAKQAVFERMWLVLSGQETGKKYARLSPADRQAVVAILRDTRTDLPSSFAR